MLLVNESQVLLARVFVHEHPIFDSEARVNEEAIFIDDVAGVFLLFERSAERQRAHVAEGNETIRLAMGGARDELLASNLFPVTRGQEGCVEARLSTFS